MKYITTHRLSLHVKDPALQRDLSMDNNYTISSPDCICVHNVHIKNWDF